MRYGNIQINNFQAGDLIEIDAGGNLIPSGVPTQSVVDSTVALSGSVDQNTADIVALSAAIDSGGSNDTPALSAAIDQNSADIVVLSGAIDTNTSNILTNTNDITTNVADIQVVSGAVDDNTSDILTNTNDITTNVADIQVLSGAIDDIVVEVENPDVDTGTENVDAFDITVGSVEWLVCVRNGNNIRTQKVLACVVNSTAEYTSITTQSVGDTSDLTISVDYSGGQIRLRATTITDNWVVKVKRQVIEI